MHSKFSSKCKVEGPSSFEDAQIESAIQAHGLWIAGLKRAIEQGATEVKLEVVTSDRACELGRWLFGNLPDRVARSEYIAQVRAVHAEFHTAAARILSSALAGNRREALEMMTSKEGNFMELSGKLILILRALQSELKPHYAAPPFPSLPY